MIRCGIDDVSFGRNGTANGLRMLDDVRTMVLMRTFPSVADCNEVNFGGSGLVQILFDVSQKLLLSVGSDE